MEIKCLSRIENIKEVNEAVEKTLISNNASKKDIDAILISLEEIFVNVCSYAYNPNLGDLIVDFNISNNRVFSLTIKDHGFPFNPILKEDPNVGLESTERPIGGLGIYMVKKLMDTAIYEYIDGWNIFLITKKI